MAGVAAAAVLLPWNALAAGRPDLLGRERVRCAVVPGRLKDIVDITGLDIYQVVGLKLLLRRAA